MASAQSFHDPGTAAGRSALVDALVRGAVAALPTETVPGLAVAATDPAAVARLGALKESPSNRPFTLHLRSQEELREMLPSLPPALPRWLARRMPGPVTVVLPRDWVALPPALDWPWETVGLRLPSHPGYLRLARELPFPLFMTSINPAGSAPLGGAELAEWLAEHPEVVWGLSPDEIGPAEPSAVASFSPLPELHRGSLPARELRPGLRVLVVCTGNICRSPLAAALLESELAAAWGVAPPDLHELGWVVASAGTMALPGCPASEHSVDAAREIGVDLARHRSQNLEDALRHDWDLVLAMSRSHLQALPRGVRGELFDPVDREIPDPFGGPLDVYRHMRDHVRRAVEDRVAAWSSWNDAR